MISDRPCLSCGGEKTKGFALCVKCQDIIHGARKRVGPALFKLVCEQRDTARAEVVQLREIVEAARQLPKPQLAQANGYVCTYCWESTDEHKPHCVVGKFEALARARESDYDSKAKAAGLRKEVVNGTVCYVGEPAVVCKHTKLAHECDECKDLSDK